MSDDASDPADCLGRDRDNFAELNDSALLGWRAGARIELDRLPPGSSAHAVLTELYDLSTEEVSNRAKTAWAKTS